MRIPGIAPGVASGGGRRHGMTQASLQFNASTRSGTALGNPLGAVYEGRAWAGVGRAITGAANEMDKLHRVRRDQTATIEMNDAYMEKTSKYIEWKKEMAKHEFLPIADMPPDMLEELGIRDTDFVVDKEGNMIEQPRTVVPKHEVFAELERRFLESQTEASSERISDPDFKSSWLESEAEYNVKQYGKSSIESVEFGVKFDTAKEMGMYEAALEAGNIELAKHIVRTMQYHSAEAKNEMMKLANKTGEENRYKKILTTVDNMAPSEAIAMLESARNHVDPANEEYRETGTKHGNNNLNMDERLAFYSSFQKKLSLVKDAAKTDYSQLIAMKKEDARNIVKSIKAGDGHNPTASAEVLTNLETLPQKNRDLVLERELRTMIALDSTIAETALLPRDSRNGRAKLYEDNIKKLDDPSVAWYLADSMKTAVNRLNTQWDKNSMEYLRKYTDTRPTPINLSGDKESLVEGFKNRTVSADIIHRKFGEGTNSLFLEGEIDQLGNLFENGELGQKLDMLYAMRDGLGEDYMRIAMDQLNNNSISSLYTQTGELLADNKPQAAKFNMLGYDTRKAFPEMTKDRESFLMTYDEVTQGAYSDPPEKGEAIMESALNIYSYIQSLAGDTTSAFNESGFETALKMAMGDRAIISFGASNIVPADSSVTQEKFDTYIDSISPDFIKTHAAAGGGLDGISEAELLSRVRNEKLALINSGANHLLLYDIDKNTGVKTKDGELFLLPMNADVINRINEVVIPPSEIADPTLSSGDLARFKDQTITGIIRRNRAMTKAAEQRIKNRKK